MGGINMEDCSKCKKHISQDGCCGGFMIETCTGYIEEKDGRMTTCDLIVSLEQLDMIIPGEKYILQNKFEVEIGKIKEVNHEEQTATIMVFIREKVLTNLQRYIKKLDGFQLL
jgi:hypothetical protein